MDVTNSTVLSDNSSLDNSKNFLIPREALLDILVAIRGSDISVEEKTNLRDTVLDYAKSGEEAVQASVLLGMLEKNAESFSGILKVIKGGTEKVNSNSVTSDAVLNKKQIEEKPVLSKARLVRTRRKPSFGATKIIPSDQKATPVSVIENQNIDSIKNDTSLDKQAPEPAPMVESDVSTPVKDQTVNENIPEPAEPVIPTDSINEPLDRIKQIKHNINELVGNPVSLVSLNDAVGREYMSALLDAMKKATGGQGGIDAAMQRLEAVYQQAVQVISENQSNPAPAESEQILKRKESIEKSEEENFNVSNQEYNVTEKDQTSLSPASVNTISQDSPSDSAAENIPSSPISKANISPVAIRKIEESNTDLVSPETHIDVPKVNSVSVGQGHSLRNLNQTNNVSAKVSAVPPVKSMDVQNQNLTQVEKQPAPQNNVSQNSQETEVTKGLEQLLSEWSLFKNSGFLGMGDSGRQHPLYKQLSHLPMSSVISGRFEGATPNIQRNISDYIKGWRYEYDVIHDVNETFEQYLTKVIRRILEKTAEAKKNKGQKTDSDT